MVLVFHSFYWYGAMAGLPRAMQIFVSATSFGRLGVNLFFVLSGFLITGLLLNSVRRADYFRTMATCRKRGPRNMRSSPI
jgi:peptidoglycan/LPS O-acetylase OafA/YrhL